MTRYWGHHQLYKKYLTDRRCKSAYDEAGVGGELGLRARVGMRVTAAAAKTKATKLITEPSRKVAVPAHMTRLGRLGVYTVMGVTAWGLEQLIR